MNISETTVLHGPNLYSRHSVVAFRLDGIAASTERGSKQLLTDLLKYLPGLSQHDMGCGAPGCPSDIDHLFEHACIELQRRAGAELCCIRGEGLHRPAEGGATVPFEESAVCIESARWVADFLAREPTADGEPAFDPVARLESFLAVALKAMLPVQDRALIKRAREMDVPVARLVGRTVVLGQGCRQQRLSATKTSLTNVVGNDLAANKAYSRKVLGDLGLPVPRFERVHRRRDAVAAVGRIGYPVVIKPNNGSMGRGISIGLKSRDEVRAAYKFAREFDRSVLVEEFVEGSDYRMLVIGGSLCAASRRVPAHVVGDGQHTIEELVAEINSDPRRGSGPTFSWTRIELDSRAKQLIEGAGYAPQSILAEGEWLYLRRNANTSDGGTAIDVTDDVHPDNRAIAVCAAKAMGLDIAGVDFLTRDIATSILENGGKICEVNSRPGIRKHLWPAEGLPRDVTTPIIEMLFPTHRPSRIPTVAVIGSGDVEGAAQLLAQILTAGGQHVGVATKRQLRSGTRTIADGALSAPESARRLMLDPELTVAILEVTPEDVESHGLGCDAYDLALIVNAEPRADDATPGELPTSLLDAIRVVTGITREAVLIDADDPSARVITETCRGKAQIHRVAARPAEKVDTVCVEFDPKGTADPLELPISGGRSLRSILLAGVAAQRLGEESTAIYSRLVGQS